MQSKTAHGDSQNLLAQLSGLRLGSGATAGNVMKRQGGGTPPSVGHRVGGAFGAFPTGSTGPRSPAAIGSGAINEVSRLLSFGAVHVGSPPPSAVATPNTAPKSQQQQQRQQQQQSVAAAATKAKDTKVVALPKPRSVQPAAAAPTPVAATAAATATAAAAAAVTAPKPRSAAAANSSTAPAAVAMAAPTIAATNGVAGSPFTTLNPKVVEFFSMHGNTAVPAAAAAKTAAAAPTTATVPVVTMSSSNTTNHNTSSSNNKTAAAAAAADQPRRGAGLTSDEKKTALAANQFLIDAFGLVDNTEADRPIIRSLPRIPSGGRYIIVGDVHGCVDQFEALVEKVRYEKGTDCLVVIGDYVNKGPDSIGVVKSCMTHAAIGVLGNHDYTLLKCIDRHRRKPFRPEDMRDPVKQLAKAFPVECEYYLRGLPHVLKLPEYNVLLVHAGFNVQHKLLEDQNVYELMHMRRLEQVVTHDASHHKKEVIKYQAVVKGSTGVPWGELWEGPEQVIFGHDAYSGFQVHTRATGIDTGCVYGDPLTCVVFSAGCPQGEYFSVPGLPKMANELRGLPPPDSNIYEQVQLELERQIIRPTPSLNAAGSPSSQRPVFLSTPVTPQSLAGQRPAAGMTATSTATNTQQYRVGGGAMTPSSLFPAMSPSTAQEVADVSAREVQKATLLALSAARELSALATVLAMPVYENSLEVMQRLDAADAVAIGSFWVPFLRSLLAGCERRLGESAGAHGHSPKVAGGGGEEDEGQEEELLEYALGVCDELAAVCAAVQPELRALQQPAVEARLSKVTKKFLSLLVE